VRAVVLLSGGIDSATVLAHALSRGYEVTTLSFDYGQRHSRELESAGKIAEHFGVKHVVVTVDLRAIGGSALTSQIAVPERRSPEEIGSEIPVTYVPARNMIMLSIAAGLAEVVDADRIFYGANAIDYSGYPDCRPEFVRAMERAINLGTKRGVEGREVRVEAPLITLTKAEIIRLGHELSVPFELTWSCYRGGEKACGRCDSCILRLKGFMEAGFEDPLTYETLPDWYAEYLEGKE
jgi:7-cyano-7-deazaguanine synthase